MPTHKTPRSRTALFSALMLAFAAPAAFAQGPSSYAEPAARMQRAAPGQALARGHDAAATVGAALRAQGAGEATAQSLVAVGRHTAQSGITHVRLVQQVGGLTVHGSDLKASFDAQGNLVGLAERVAAVPAGTPRAATINERQALDAAMARVHPGVKPAFSAGARAGATQAFKGGGWFHEDPQVTRVLVPQDDGSLAQGFVVQTWTQKGNQLHRTLVGGDGAVLHDELRTQNDSYNVYLKDPGQGPQTTVTGGPTAQSPSGWLGSGAQTSININGNNVSAYLDKDANNAPDAGGTAVTDGNFVTAANLSVAPDTTGNKNVAVQNLFYLNNRVHDILYGHGFTESAGNFQINNFGKGGAGNDPVNAEAQDGSGTDNANFSTPTDGTRPRMQMYLWTGATPPNEVVVGSAKYDATGAEFGPAPTTTGTSGALAVAGGSLDGCSTVTGVSGKVAIVDRGTCDFAVKVTNVQKAGAIAMVVANNVAGAPITMGGSPKSIRIPSVMVSQSDGGILKGLAGSGSTVRKKSTTPLQIDGDLDSDVVFHEYGHGLSWRMIGGMSGPLAGAIGEGASDTVAFMINGSDKVGVYASSSPAGIRRYPYAGYPLKYSDVTGQEVHNDGEIYAAAMWRLHELWQAAGRSNDSLFDVFVDGMNYTPSTPAYEDMRNGMLQSIAHGGAADANAQCSLVWQAFAQFGIGDGAKGTVTRRGTVSITPSTLTRSNCTF